MRIGKWIFFAVAAIAFAACGSEVENTEVVRETPEALQVVDNMMQRFTSTPQMLSASGSKNSKVVGSRGTIIHINPNKLETVNGKPVGNKIDIALLEVGDKVNMMLNNVTTLSDDELLESGGAFYIKMWSKGSELRLKEGETLAIEYPIWVGTDMELFYGKKDSLGQIGWAESAITFAEKEIENPKKPINPEESKNADDISKQEYDGYLLSIQNYKKQKKEIADARKTFAPSEIAKLGWTSAAKTSKGNVDISLKVKSKEGISRARFYAIVKGANSVVASNYRSGGGEVVFENLPEGKEIVIIGVSVREESSFLFVEEVMSKKGLELEAQLTPVSPEELRMAISRAS